MIAKISRWGNSLGLRLPLPVAKELGLAAGSELDIRLQDGTAVLSPRRARKYSLGVLLAEVRPGRIPPP